MLLNNGKLPSTFSCNPVALEQARDIVSDPDKFYTNFDLYKHRKRMRSLEGVVDDVAGEDEWDPDMQQQAPDDTIIVGPNL